MITVYLHDKIAVLIHAPDLQNSLVTTILLYTHRRPSAQSGGMLKTELRVYIG
jgi:hypothetical protein